MRESGSMKRLFYILTFALLIGCTDYKEQEDMLAINFGAPKQLYSSFERMASRTVAVDDKYLNWSEGDQIAYFPRMNYAVHYQLKSTTASQEGYYAFERLSESIEQGAALNYGYAVYPYSEDITVISEGNIAIRLPEVQHYAENSFGVGAAPMVAVTSGGADEVLQFKNAVGFLKLQLYANNMAIKRIELSGNNGEKLAGEAVIIAESGANPKISTSNSTIEKITLDCGSGVTLGTTAETATAFWFALPDMEFTNGFTLTIYDSDNTPYVKATSKSYTIERNTIQPMKAFDVKSNSDISEEEGKVLFYLAERNGGFRSVAGAEPLSWKDCTVSVNGKEYDIESDASGDPYILVDHNEANSYKAILHTPDSAKWYVTTPYESIVLPCSQFDMSMVETIRSFPMYATYSKANGRTLAFDYGFALLRLRLKGEGKIVSIKAESSTRYDVTGIVAKEVSDSGSYKVDKGMNFATLNCTNNGEYVTLNPAEARDFYLMVAPSSYDNGLNISVCDSDYKAAFYEISNLQLKAGDIYTLDKEYAPSDDLIFYEGFDNCVWGGDIMRGEEGVGFAPNGTTIGTTSELTRTGYEAATTMVAYNNPGSAFVQSNTWSNVSGKTVGTSHQVSDSYVTSRHFADNKYLFRTQEYPGYIAVGAGNSGRGIYVTPQFSNMSDIGSCSIKIRFALQANFNGELAFYTPGVGAIVKSAKLDGTAITLTTDNCYYNGNKVAFKLKQLGISAPSSATEKKEWHTLEFEIEGVTNGTAVHITDDIVSSGIHGIYVDSVEASKSSSWQRKPTTLRVIMWNIQNGMWADQHNNYDNFVEWVKRWDADICIWCESETIYKDMSNKSASTKYLTDGWGELAARYGHSYAKVGGNRDNYPQTITSKYEITVEQRITDTDVEGKPISHGAGHFTIVKDGKKINIVTMHMWPQSYGYGVASADRETSTANSEGHKYRAFEMQYIVDNTVNNEKYAAEEYWIIGGDTNARSRLDNWHYQYADTSAALLTHDIILNNTNLKDVIAHRYPGHFIPTTAGDGARIDIVYTSPALYDVMDNSAVLMDRWIYGTSKSQYYSSFQDPSDHRPLIMDFDLSKLK